MTHGEITIKNAVPQYLRMTRLVFQRLGVETEVRGEDLFVKGSERYTFEHDLGGAIPKVQSQVWPGFPSDLHEHRDGDGHAGGMHRADPRVDVPRAHVLGRLAGEHGSACWCSADPHRVVVIGPSQLYGGRGPQPRYPRGHGAARGRRCAQRARAS